MNGRPIAENILSNLKDNIIEKPRIAIVLVGQDEQSKAFVEFKEKALKEIGVECELLHFNDSTEEELLSIIKGLNEKKQVNGILVQLPLPEHIDENKIFNQISPEKDVDGLNPTNLGNLMLGSKTVIPCTVRGIMQLLKEYKIPVAGKHVVIISRSALIGKPLAMALLQEDATVTICHSKTKDLHLHTINADIIISATGTPNFIMPFMVSKDAVIIDAGYAVLNRKIAGDVNHEVYDKVSMITPVPGGVGPLTIAMVAQNLFDLKIQQKDFPKIRVLWLSANKFGYEMLKEAAKLSDIEIIGVMTLSEKATTVMYDEVEKERWYELGIPVYKTERVNDEAELIKQLHPDLIVEAGWRQIISNEILQIPNLGTIGFHPTLLPHGRGPAPIINTILEGSEISGVTLFYLTDKVDAGDIIGQIAFKIEPSDYAEDVYRKVVEAGKTIVQTHLPLIARCIAERTSQDEIHATTFPKHTLANNALVLALPSASLPKDIADKHFVAVMRKIRALSKPYRGAYIQLANDRKLVIWKAELE